MYNVFDVRGGQVMVPGRVAVRYGQGLWGPAYLPLCGYFGWFHNPKFTELFVLEDGYVPQGTQAIENFSKHYFPCALVDAKTPAPAEIRLQRADGLLEREWLEDCRNRMHDYDSLTNEDRAARQRVLGHIAKRLTELPAPQPTQPASDISRVLD